MKVKFHLEDQKSIANFIYILKTLHGNSPEVCLSFSKAGMSLSQSWDNKFCDMSDTAKYFFFIESLQFAKITCQDSSNYRVRLNIKEVLSKLKGLKKELREVIISVTNEFKDKEPNPDYCLFELIAGLFTYGTVIYKNGCRLEQTSKDFLPLTYYDHIHQNKSLLLVAEPKKLQFLQDFRNDFVELFLKEEKVEVKFYYESVITSKLCGTIKSKKVNLNASSCFLAYNYDKVIEMIKESESLTLPPNHLLRYRDACEKWSKNVTIHIETTVPFQGFLKLFCSTKVDKNIFILKLKAKLNENIITVQKLLNVKPVSSQTETRNTLQDQSTRNTRMISTATCQRESRGSTLPFSIEENLIQGFYSIPNERIFNHMGEDLLRSESTIMSKKKKNPFKFSQEEEGFKKTKLSLNKYDQDDQILTISMSKQVERPVQKVRSILFSPEKSQEVVMKDESQGTREFWRRNESGERKSNPVRANSGKKVKVQNSGKSSEKAKRRKGYEAENEAQAPTSPFLPRNLFPTKATRRLKINFTANKDKKEDEERVPLAGTIDAEQASACNRSFFNNLSEITKSMKL